MTVVTWWTEYIVGSIEPPKSTTTKRKRNGKVIGSALVVAVKLMDDEQTRSKDPKEPSLPSEEGGKNNRVR